MSAGVEMSRLMLEMRAMQAEAQALTQPSPTPPVQPAAGEGPEGVAGAGFGELFKQAVDGVNGRQMEAKALVTAVETGDTEVAISEVMIASQKASLSFQAMMQVRNRLVSAYEDIMNMPI
jgi:flagellar hook-basal body complex protein FliE